MSRYTILLLLGLSAEAALAAGDALRGADANGDGFLTLGEIRAIHPGMSAASFAEIDTNDDGALDASETAAGQEKGLIPAPSGG